MNKIIHGEIWAEDFSKLNNLITDFQSCIRFCYTRFKKENLSFNDVRKIAKEKYHSLNTRQISDAVVQGQTIYVRHKNKKIIFGGRKNWENYKSGKITKDQWISNKNKQLYFRGDTTKKGNLNARITANALRVTIGTRQWICYKLFIPNKFSIELKELIESGKAYNVRLIRKNYTHFSVIIDYKKDHNLTTPIDFSDGAIGVDTNPDRIAVANVTKDGNLVGTQSLINNRILYAIKEKRDYDIGCLVKKVINYAKKQNKGIVFEDLNFKREFKTHEKKWNRKKSTFAWKKFINLLERKCIQNNIKYKKVNPAFTSIIGKYKYRWMYKVNIHESAAYVIGRRGLGFNEKLSFNAFHKTHE
jgi:IS605 OrfB family transposase